MLLKSKPKLGLTTQFLGLPIAQETRLSTKGRSGSHSSVLNPYRRSLIWSTASKPKKWQRKAHLDLLRPCSRIPFLVNVKSVAHNLRWASLEDLLELHLLRLAWMMATFLVALWVLEAVDGFIWGWHFLGDWMVGIVRVSAPTMADGAGCRSDETRHWFSGSD